MSDTLFIITLFATLGCGLMGGLFFIFSNTIMRALGRLRPEAGMAAMQAINLIILNPLFALVFFGTAVACGYLVVVSILNWSAPGTFYLLGGGLLYLIGCILVTFVFNIPLNDALAKADPASEEGKELWNLYLRKWTAWNHVRTIMVMTAVIFLILAFKMVQT